MSEIELLEEFNGMRKYRGIEFTILEKRSEYVPLVVIKKENPKKDYSILVTLNTEVYTIKGQTPPFSKEIDLKVECRKNKCPYLIPRNGGRVIFLQTEPLNRNLLIELDEEYFRLLSEKRIRKVSESLLKRLQKNYTINAEDLEKLGDLIDTPKLFNIEK